MDLSFGEKYDTFRDTLRRFIEENAHLAPTAGEDDLEKMRAWQRLLIENGYAARTIPKEYGGGGMEPDIPESRSMAEEFARAQVSSGTAGQGIACLGPGRWGKGRGWGRTGGLRL